MPWCKTAVTLFLAHWSYCRLALSHWYDYRHIVATTNREAESPPDFEVINSTPLQWYHMSVMASQIISSQTDLSSAYSGNPESPYNWCFVGEIHRWPSKSPISILWIYHQRHRIPRPMSTSFNNLTKTMVRYQQCMVSGQINVESAKIIWTNTISCSDQFHQPVT